MNDVVSKWKLEGAAGIATLPTQVRTHGVTSGATNLACQATALLAAWFPLLLARVAPVSF
jgi:hypothetical protein